VEDDAPQEVVTHLVPHPHQVAGIGAVGGGGRLDLDPHRPPMADCEHQVDLVAPPSRAKVAYRDVRMSRADLHAQLGVHEVLDHGAEQPPVAENLFTGHTCRGRDECGIDEEPLRHVDQLPQAVVVPGRYPLDDMQASEDVLVPLGRLSRHTGNPEDRCVVADLRGVQGEGFEIRARAIRVAATEYLGDIPVDDAVGVRAVPQSPVRRIQREACFGESARQRDVNVVDVRGRVRRWRHGLAGE
jgi:hypothetical protein